MHTLYNLLVFLMLLAVATGVGAVILYRLKPTGIDRTESWLFSLALGEGVFVLGTAALGFLHALRPFTMTFFLVSCALVACWGGYQMKRAHSLNSENFAKAASVFPLPIIYGILSTYTVYFLMSTLTPPMEGDTLHSYLDVPRQFVDAGGIISLPYELHGTVPLNMQMLSTLALMVRGDEVAQMLVGFGMGVSCGTVVFLMGKRFVSQEVGLIAAFLFLSMNVIQPLVASTKVNLGGSFYDLLAVYAMLQWYNEGCVDNAWLIMGGILSGLALGTFYSAGFTAVVLACFIVWMVRREPMRAVLSVCFYGIPVVLLASPWLIRSFIETGNPFFPILNSVFNLPDVDLIRHARGITGLATILWDMTIGYIANNYGRPVGPLVLGVLPFIFLSRPIPAFIRMILVILLPMYLFWYAGVQRPRNFLTGLGLTSIISAFLYMRISIKRRFVLRGILVLFMLYACINMVGSIMSFIKAGNISYIFGLQSREKYLSKALESSFALPNAKMLDYMNNRLQPESRILSLYLGNGYYVKPTFIDSRMIDGDFMHDAAKNREDLVRQWRAAGITHVFLNAPYVNKMIGADPGKWPQDYRVFKDPKFSQYLKKIFYSREQILYAFIPDPLK